MSLEGLSDRGLDRVEAVLDYIARRQEALAANVANAATPGYQTVDLRFSEELSSAVSSWKVTRTSPRHLEVEVPEPALELAVVPGLVSRPDGNNVQLDRELLALTVNRLRFQMATQWASSRIRAIRSAIEERGAL